MDLRSEGLLAQRSPIAAESEAFGDTKETVTNLL